MNILNATKAANADETADDVKIYIRHNAHEIIEDFYEQFKLEKESRKFHYSNGEAK